ncbi:MAG: hypothetical protein JXB48_16215 [Candidatus Latescibacteria bacterium]|nr:hypothetical protein [Candidatus Latescibacterota bacterium]
MKTIVFSCILACLLTVCITGISGADQTIAYRNTKTIGMGNTRIAGGFDYNGFIDNPALLSRVKFIRFSVLRLPVTINKDLWDTAKFIDDNQDNFENYDDLSEEEKVKFLDDLKDYDGKWTRARVSPMIDVAASLGGYGIGFALFQATNAALKIDRGVYEPRVWGEGNVYYTGVLGIAKPLSILTPGLTIGANLKFIQRQNAPLFHIKATDLGNINDTLDPIIEDAKNSKHNTFAIDLGMLYDIPFIDSEVGATIQSIGDGKGSSIDFGFAKRFYDDDLILLVDYIDFLDNNRENIFRKTHFGVQYRYEYLVLRTGINSGYPSLGAGLNFRVFDLDFAWFSEELSNAPGVEDDTRYALQFKFGW